ncbi:MAG: right-handed parallel beta-helix repeat-containing protein [Planctomycetes bacterium]|nr:right-handed parallel beta-helix repeat-containing protein [Planctomycetota bacterium]
MTFPTIGSLIFMALAPTAPPQDPQPAAAETFGAAAKPDGDPLGGGPGYRDIRTAGDHRVTDKDSLLRALRAAKPGDVVFVDGAASIDLTGEQRLAIPAGVTLASDRGRDGSPGALLFSTEDRPTPTKPERFALFVTGGAGVRVTGIRLRGPDEAQRERYEHLNSDGVQADHGDLEVDNCELWGWSHGGVWLRRGRGHRVHHCSIHHCQRKGLGYGVVLDVAEARICGNVFDWCRHAIAATGRPGSGYEACHNHVLGHANGHSFDMHGGRDRKDGTDVAGDWLKIHHNTFGAAHVYAVVIRGVPRERAEVHHNWFTASDTVRAVRQLNKRGNLHVGANLFGER